MILQSFEVKNFRSIVQPMSLKLSSSINIFIGQNNSGKTNILDAVEGVCSGNKSFSAIATATVKDGSKIYTAASSKKIPYKRIGDEHIFDFEQIDRDYKSLQNDYPREYARMNQILNKFFPQLWFPDKSLSMNLGMSEGQARQSDTIIFEKIGSGLQKIFVIVLYAVHPDYPVVLLDEPEAHLHPALIKRLAEVLSSSVTNQVLMTTHSPLFIDPHYIHHIYRVARTHEQGTHIHTLNESKITVNKRRLVQELDADNLEMFFADRVLLVEGVSDRILMRGLLDRFYNGPHEIKVVYTHGKGNTDVYMSLLNAFHIDFVVMLDLDALGWWTEKFLQINHARFSHGKKNKIIDELKHYRIYVLPNGTIERNYPRAYQKSKKKPLNALYAAQHIGRQEYESDVMKNVREIINVLAYDVTH